MWKAILPFTICFTDFKLGKIYNITQSTFDENHKQTTMTVCYSSGSANTQVNDWNDTRIIEAVDEMECKFSTSLGWL